MVLEEQETWRTRDLKSEILEEKGSKNKWEMKNKELKERERHKYSRAFSKIN